MRLRHVSTAILVILAVAAGVLVYFLGGSGVGSGGGLEVDAVEVALNDDLAGDVEGVESGSAVCAGPPPDHFAVRIRATIHDADSGRYVSEDSYDLEVRIGGESATRTVSVVDGTSRSVRDTVLVRDDDSVDPDNEATVTVSLVHDGNTVDSATRTVSVTERDMNCENVDD